MIYGRRRIWRWRNRRRRRLKPTLQAEARATYFIQLRRMVSSVGGRKESGSCRRRLEVMRRDQQAESSSVESTKTDPRKRRDQIPSFSTTASTESPSRRCAAARRRCFMVSDFSRYAVSRSEAISRHNSMGTRTAVVSPASLETIWMSVSGTTSVHIGFKRLQFKDASQSCAFCCFSRHGQGLFCGRSEAEGESDYYGYRAGAAQ